VSCGKKCSLQRSSVSSVSHLQAQVSKTSKAAIFLSRLSDIKIILVPVRINFASVRYFQRQEGRQ